LASSIFNPSGISFHHVYEMSCAPRRPLSENQICGVHLYDHETDPQELNNLADDPAQRGRVAQLKVQVEKHLQQVGGE